MSKKSKNLNEKELNAWWRRLPVNLKQLAHAAAEPWREIFEQFPDERKSA